MAKYLIGQAPAYASYIAVGCGKKPLLTGTDTSGLYADKEQLDFEMFRVPVISKGYVNDSGQDKVVLTAELPTQERYEITEIGVYSAAANPSAISYDSRMVYSFSSTEGWELHSDSISAIPSKLASLGDNTTPYNIIQTDKAFFSNADNKTLQNSTRIERYEIPRYLNSTLIVSGDMSDLPYANQRISGESGDHVHITGINANYNKNSPLDQFRLAFSVLSREANSTTIPDSVRVLLEFTSADNIGGGSSAAYARMEVVVDDISSTDVDTVKHDFTNDRYIVYSINLADLQTSSDFSWSQITAVKVYASAYANGSSTPTNDFYIALDGLRLENTDSENPLYGLVGYTAIKTDDEMPITKFANTANLIEFRFGLGVA